MCGYNIWSYYQMQINRERPRKCKGFIILRVLWESQGTPRRATQEKHYMGHRPRQGVGLLLKGFVMVSVVQKEQDWASRFRID